MLWAVGWKAQSFVIYLRTTRPRQLSVAQHAPNTDVRLRLRRTSETISRSAPSAETRTPRRTRDPAGAAHGDPGGESRGENITKHVLFNSQCCTNAAYNITLDTGGCVQSSRPVTHCGLEGGRGQSRSDGGAAAQNEECAQGAVTRAVQPTCHPLWPCRREGTVSVGRRLRSGPCGPALGSARACASTREGTAEHRVATG